MPENDKRYLYPVILTAAGWLLFLFSAISGDYSFCVLWPLGLLLNLIGIIYGAILLFKHIFIVQVPLHKIFTLLISILFSILYILTCTPTYIRELPPETVCGSHLRSLGKQIMVYANDHNEFYPTAEKWCDLLIAQADASPKVFICPGSDVLECESSYAFNKNLANKKVPDEPNDVVLLFETDYGKTNGKRDVSRYTREYYRLMGIEIKENKDFVYKDRWNQVGGPEILTADNHKGVGANILFNDGHVEFVKKKDFGKLNWGVPQEPNTIKSIK